MNRVARAQRLASVLGLWLSAQWVSPASLHAQAGTLQGRVRDEQGATIDGARITLRRVADAPILGVTETDELGFYRLDGVPRGSVFVVVERLGYAAFSVEVTIAAGASRTLDVVLLIEALQVEGLRVRGAARPRDEVVFDEQAGMTVRAIEVAELRTIPGFIEADPLRAAEVLPGVITTSDFSAAFNVRGGSADQNLILVDGLPVFNPAHLGGLVSIFNPDMVRRAELRSGGFPAEYGGRVSSVLEIETDPGDGRWDLDGAMSLLTSRASLAGGLSEGTRRALSLRDAKWRVAGRRSYFDVLFAPFFDVPYSLADVQAIFEGWTSAGDRVSFTGYSGGDLLDLTTLDSEDFPLRIDWEWGNDLIGGRWTHLRPGGRVLDVRVGYSRFDTGLRFPDFDDTDFSSRISQATLAADWESRPARGLISKVGIEGRRMDYATSVVTGGTEFAGGEGEGWGAATYGQLQWRPNDAWLLEAGVRFDGWYPDGWESTTEVSPRLSLKRFFGGGTWAAKASVGRFAQFLHSIRDEEVPLGLDIWVLTGHQAPAVVSDQAQLGFEVSPGDGWFGSIEGYVRDFDGVVTTNFADNPNDDFDDYLPGRGLSYGVDVFVRKSTGRTTGWLSLSFLKADRTFPDFNSGLDPLPEVEYPPIFDRRVDVDLILSRTFGPNVEVGLRWNFGTGLPYTQPVGSFPFLDPRIGDGRLEWDVEVDEDDPDPDEAPGNRVFGILLDERNSSRYPIRHRLDVSLRKRYLKSWGTLTPYISVLNVYNRKNVLFYFFQYERDPPVRSGISMFPLVPTFGAEVKF